MDMNEFDIVNVMPQESKEKWLAALRSGDYLQGTGRLYKKDNNSYCCLGVLQHCLTGEVEQVYDNKSAVVPSAAWLAAQNIKFMHGGTHESVPWFVLDGDMMQASWLNDLARLPFNRIADLIEEQVEGV